jgi:two-component sensor histidine kinase
MDLKAATKHPVLKWAIYFGAWTLVGIFWATRMWLLYKDAGADAVTWMEAMTLGLVEWYLWAIISIPIFKLSARLPFDRAHWPRSLAVHAAGAVLASMLQIFLYNAAFRPLDGYFMQTWPPLGMDNWWDTYWLWLRAKFHVGLMAYALVAIVSYAVSYYQRYRREELQASELRAQLAGAQLEVLKSQLHPHFLFNALHTISSLMHENINAADSMIGRLGDLLRRSLRRASDQEVTLREELEFAERYLEIERVRFSDRMQVKLEVDPEVLDASVPNLILHPLVENAVRHGISGTIEGGTVSVTAARDGDTLNMVVSDDGVGQGDPDSQPRGEGVGLTNTRERLQRLYGDQHQLSIQNGAGAGFTVTIRIPLRKHPETVPQE